jgi:fluoroquinolone resistance protein
MNLPEIENHLKNIQTLDASDFENTQFTSCQFQDLAHIRFTDSIFDSCDLSNCHINDSAFQNVKFINCKLLGLHFESCSPLLFETEFINCALDHSSFFNMKIKNLLFNNCQLIEVDFTGADIPKVIFENCNLLNTKFENSNLSGADLKTAVNFNINPTINKIKKAHFSRNAIEGLLYSFDIHLHT